MPVSIHISLFTALLGAGLLAALPLSLAGGLDVGNFRNHSDQRDDHSNISSPHRRAIAQLRTAPQTPEVRPPSPGKPLVPSTLNGKRPRTGSLKRVKIPRKNRQIIPPRQKSPASYNRSVRKMIRHHNKKGRSFGHIKLYVRENRWGPAVKIQSCYGDNIMTSFTLLNKPQTGDVWFEFKNATFRNRGRRRHKWITVNPGMIIRGRTIYLRAQSSKGNGVVTLKVKGNCIEDPPKNEESKNNTNRP